MKKSIYSNKVQTKMYKKQKSEKKPQERCHSHGNGENELFGFLFDDVVKNYIKIIIADAA